MCVNFSFIDFDISNLLLHLPLLHFKRINSRGINKKKEIFKTASRFENIWPKIANIFLVLSILKYMILYIEIYKKIIIINLLLISNFYPVIHRWIQKEDELLCWSLVMVRSQCKRRNLNFNVFVTPRHFIQGIRVLGGPFARPRGIGLFPRETIRENNRVAIIERSNHPIVPPTAVPPIFRQTPRCKLRLTRCNLSVWSMPGTTICAARRTETEKEDGGRCCIVSFFFFLPTTKWTT